MSHESGERGPTSKDCSALLDELPDPHSETVAKEMRDCHPQPQVEVVAREKLFAEAPVSLPRLLRSPWFKMPSFPSRWVLLQDRRASIKQGFWVDSTSTHTRFANRKHNPSTTVFFVACCTISFCACCTCNPYITQFFRLGHNTHKTTHNTITTHHARTHTHFFSSNFGCVLMIRDKLLIVFVGEPREPAIETAATSKEGGRRAN